MSLRNFLIQLFENREQFWRQFFSRTRLIIGSQFLADYLVVLRPGTQFLAHHTSD